MDKLEKNWYIWKLMQAIGFTEDDLNRNYFSLSWTETERLIAIAQVCGIRPNKQGWTRSRVLFYRMKKFINELPF